MEKKLKKYNELTADELYDIMKLRVDVFIRPERITHAYLCYFLSTFVDFQQIADTANS